MSDEMKKIVLFKDMAPDVVAFEKIYDPDVDGIDPAAKGKIIPSKQSLVVEQIGTAMYSLWVVDHVDANYKTHLVRPQIVSTDDDAPNRIVGYGNDTYMLFYDQRQSELRLQLDSKLVFYGTRFSAFKLFKTGPNRVTKVISRRKSSTDTVTGTAVPITPIDPENRDTRRVFVKQETWSAFVEAATNTGARDWDITLGFCLNSLSNPNEPSANLDIFNSHGQSGRFGAYVNKSNNQIVIWINRGNSILNWTAPAGSNLHLDHTVRYVKAGSRLVVYFNNTKVIDTTTDGGYVGMWDQIFEDPITYGDVILNTLQFTDATFDRVVWEAPYSSLWSSMGLTSPVVLRGEDCLAIENVTLTDGEPISMVVYEELKDNLGTSVLVETMTLTLIARKATTIAENDFSSVALMSLDVDLNGDYTTADDWILRRGMNINTLSMTPKLIFEDGTVQYVPIDDISCFCYGRDDVMSNTVGMEYDLLFKFFPSKNLTLFPDLQNRTDRNALECMKTVRIVPEVSTTIAKLSVVPIWNNATSSYTLQYWAYTRDHGLATLLPASAITITNGSFVGNSTRFGVNQAFVVQANITNTSGKVETFTQSFVVQVNNYTTPDTRAPWLISEVASDVLVYGSNSMPYRRPRIMWDNTVSMYRINAVTFDTTEKFILNHYTASHPPQYQIGTSQADAKPPTPTHFILRDLTTGTAITVPIAIEEQVPFGDDFQTVLRFQEPFNITYANNKNEWVDKTVLLEFLQNNSGVYSVLYGAPVEIR